MYDPKVTREQILHDLKYLAASSQATYGEGHPELVSGTPEGASVFVHDEPYGAMANAHAIAIMTEWDEFKSYDWQKVYNNMQKPAFVFDGRNILDAAMLRKIEFEYKSIGKS